MHALPRSRGTAKNSPRPHCALELCTLCPRCPRAVRRRSQECHRVPCPTPDLDQARSTPTWRKTRCARPSPRHQLVALAAELRLCRRHPLLELLARRDRETEGERRRAALRGGRSQEQGHEPRAPTAAPHRASCAESASHQRAPLTRSQAACVGRRASIKLPGGFCQQRNRTDGRRATIATTRVSSSIVLPPPSGRFLFWSPEGARAERLIADRRHHVRTINRCARSGSHPLHSSREHAMSPNSRPKRFSQTAPPGLDATSSAGGASSRRLHQHSTALHCASTLSCQVKASRSRVGTSWRRTCHTHLLTRAQARKRCGASPHPNEKDEQSVPRTDKSASNVGSRRQAPRRLVAKATRIFARVAGNKLGRLLLDGCCPIVPPRLKIH